MRYYITKTEKRLIIFAIVFYTILGLAVCFKGMSLMAEYQELVKENEDLKSVIEVLESREKTRDVKK